MPAHHGGYTRVPVSRPARLHQLKSDIYVHNLHAGLLVHADDQTALLVEAQGVDIQLTDGAGLTRKGRIVTIEPETLRWGLMSASSRIRQMLERLIPACASWWSSAVAISAMLHRVADSGYRPVSGSRATRRRPVQRGKAPRPPWARRILQASESMGEIPLRHRRTVDDHSASRWRSSDSAADRALRPAGSAGTGTPRLGAWNAPGRVPLTAPDPRPLTSLGAHKGLA